MKKITMWMDVHRTALQRGRTEEEEETEKNKKKKKRKNNR